LWKTKGLDGRCIIHGENMEIKINLNCNLYIAKNTHGRYR